MLLSSQFKVPHPSREVDRELGPILGGNELDPLAQGYDDSDGMWQVPEESNSMDAYIRGFWFPPYALPESGSLPVEPNQIELGRGAYDVPWLPGRFR